MLFSKSTSSSGECEQQGLIPDIWTHLFSGRPGPTIPVHGPGHFGGRVPLSMQTWDESGDGFKNTKRIMKKYKKRPKLRLSALPLHIPRNADQVIFLKIEFGFIFPFFFQNHPPCLGVKSLHPPVAPQEWDYSENGTEQQTRNFCTAPPDLRYHLGVGGPHTKEKGQSTSQPDKGIIGDRPL